ncbi:holo-ACP synthase [Clostridium niameyense]|uniref:Holo-[acyl-carrier-protein] synthase n=1 Tax=Clostridium niameyense TaxID=1622073 RepID=A0A6M0R8Z0_9CLOT|nr:holo-ACP synthase [Clostridium niameyense]NEZ46711.1 holo-ACP synthase [Clostridium niameyense]
MVLGVGIDIIEIRRIDSAIKRNKNFLDKLFTDKEIEYFKSRKLRTEFIAGRFAAKEAISKALGTGFRGFSLKDIEIQNDDLGKPIVYLKNNAQKKANSFGKYKIHLSISHSEDNAVAYALMEVF